MKGSEKAAVGIIIGLLIVAIVVNLYLNNSTNKKLVALTDQGTKIETRVADLEKKKETGELSTVNEIRLNGVETAVQDLKKCCEDKPKPEKPAKAKKTRKSGGGYIQTENTEITRNENNSINVRDIKIEVIHPAEPNVIRITPEKADTSSGDNIPNKTGGVETIYRYPKININNDD